MANLRIAELDFDQIKSNFKAYLTAQNEFTDYDFEGSGLSVLLDILAYNTHYNAYLANMMVNEMFLDSAVKRSSAVSIAKHLGYVPASARGAIANLTVTAISPPGLPSTLTMDAYTPFSTSIGGVSYTFLTKEAKTAYRTNLSYVFSDVDVVEGSLVQFNFVVSATGPDQKYEIVNKAIDTSTLIVTVQNSASDLTTTSYTLATDITNLDSTSKVFFLEENARENYEVYFGDGILGKLLTTGNIVTIKVISTNATLGNISTKITQSFSAVSSIGNSESTTVAVNTKSNGGLEKESLTSIKFNAPKINAASNRLVTAADYETIIAANYNNAESVIVWGGEDNDPPIYGKVMISLKPYSGYTISQSTKAAIASDILKNKKVLAIQTVFVDPEYFYIQLIVDITYNPTVTTMTVGNLQTNVTSAIEDYFSTDLQKFNKTYNKSKLINNLIDINTSVISVNVREKLQKRLQVVLNSTNVYNSETSLKFRNAIQPGQISSSYFYILNGATTALVKLADLPNETPPNLNGMGTLRLLDARTDVVISQNIGSIDYANGIISILGITPTGFPANVNELAITCGIQETGRNLSVARNEIFVLDDYTLNALGGRVAGTEINISAVYQ